MSSWSWFFRECTPKGERLRSASSYLAYSAMLMIVANLLTTRLHVLAGFTFTCALLLASLVLINRIPVIEIQAKNIEGGPTEPLGGLLWPYYADSSLSYRLIRGLCSR
jgi:hypothetical protein